MKNLSEELLERYRDGELREKDAKLVEAALERDSKGAAAARRVDRLGDMVRLMGEEALSSVSFEGFEERVMNAVARERRPSLAQRARVWLAEFLEHRKAIWIPATSLAGAAAAILLVVPLLTGAPNQAPRMVDQAGGIWAAAAGQPPAPGGSLVVILNRAQAQGTEYQLMNDRGESIGVAWIND